MNKIDALLERLESMYDHRGDGIPTQHVNPDGPEAAKVIREMREALMRITEVGPHGTRALNGMSCHAIARYALGREG